MSPSSLGLSYIHVTQVPFDTMKEVDADRLIAGKIKNRFLAIQVHVAKLMCWHACRCFLKATTTFLFCVFLSRLLFKRCRWCMRRIVLISCRYALSAGRKPITLSSMWRHFSTQSTIVHSGMNLACP